MTARSILRKPLPFTRGQFFSWFAIWFFVAACAVFLSGKVT